MDEWGPPMENVIYAMLARQKDQFHLVYVDVCESTQEASFFVSNPDFKCWMEKARSEQNLYVAILPMFDADAGGRKHVRDRLVLALRPPCNK